MSNIEHRAVIKFLTKQGKSVENILSEMKVVYGENCPGKTMVYKWSRLFKQGRESLEDDDRPGRPSDVTTHEMVIKVDDAVRENSRIKLKELAKMFKISETTAYKILHDLGMSKISARWVPRMLTPLQKKYRVDCCKEFINLCSENPRDFINRIVTGDETWIHFYDPESKQESMQWHLKGGPAPKKFKVVPSAGKVMATIFWDSEGVLLIDYKSKGITITGMYYAEILNKLRDEIKKKRRGKLTKGVVILHDNAPVHTARIAMSAMASCGFEQIDHPPYSPDLAPSDYFLFPNLKKDIRGRHFDTNESLEAAVNDHFEDKDKSYFYGGLEKLIQRCKKCIEVRGEYIEK